MQKMNRTRASAFNPIWVGGILLLVSACSSLIPSQPPSESTHGTDTPLHPISPTQGEATQMNPSLSTPADPISQRLIEKAKADLAQRLSISAPQISLVEVAQVEWSDSSLGCPQPGMDYLQVITPGYLIRLEAAGQEYEYHSNRDTYFVLCENSSPPDLLKP